MSNSTLSLRAACAALFFAATLFAQQGSTPQNGHNPVAPTPSPTAHLSNPNTPQDGSTVLGPTYQASACGLNYTTASNKIGQRFSPVGVPQPATFAIAGIPAAATILKAFVWCDASGNGIAININVTNPFTVATNYGMTLIGSDQDKCWGYGGTHSYRADVTSCITGNGNYTISGFPVNPPTSGNDVDGATMMVIWSDATQNYQGDITIWDGCVVINGGVTTQTINNFTACSGTVNNARAFMAIADLQGLGAQLVMNGSAPFGITEDWWNYIDQPTTVTPSQSSSVFNVTSGGDCYNFCMMGLYYQSNCQTCCAAPYTLSMSQVPSQCSANNGTATATPNGGSGPFTYAWNTTPAQATQTATNLAPGQYIVTVTDALGCTTIDTVVVMGAGALPFATSQVNVLCNGGNNGQAVFTPTGGTAPFTYAWTPNVSVTGTASTLIAGTYVVDCTDNFGCSASFTFNITEPPLIPISSNPSAPVPICIGGSSTISMNPTGGAPPYNYTWLTTPAQNTQSITVSPTVTTTYSCVVGDACGNQADTGIVIVTVNPPPVISFSGDDVDGCAQHCVNFVPQSSPAIQSLIWDFGDGVQSISNLVQHCYDSAGQYTVSLAVVDINSCTNTVVTPNYITVYPDPVAGFNILTPMPTTLNEATVSFDDLSIGGDTCKWDFDDGSGIQIMNCGDVTNMYDDTGFYQVMQIVVNQYGCADTAYNEVIIIPNTTFYVPNTFTPNGDGKNDVFLAYGVYVADFHMMVFDRWGMLIFESKDMNNGWDGRVRNNGGTPAQIDTYVWKITYTEEYGGYYHRLVGHVNLIR